MAASTDWLILGAGVGGLALAAKLAEHSKKFLVIEADKRTIGSGTGLLLAPNGTRILSNLGLLNAALNAGHLTTDWTILDHHGATLRKLQIPPEGPPAVSIHRADLLSIMQAKLPAGSVLSGVPATGIQNRGDHLEVRLADESTVTGNFLVGADGIRSLVRHHLFGELALHYRGYVGWRGIAPFVPPAYSGSTLSESWGPGGRFGIAPVDASRTYWYASANKAKSWTEDSRVRKANLLTHFARWHDPVTDLIDGTPEDQILVSRIYDAPALASWSKGKITLLGDAAHAMTPNLGQGACLALEDAWTLGSLIASSIRPEQIFARYQTHRMPRARSLQQQSRAMGWVVQAEHPLALAARKWITPRLPGPLLSAGMRSIFAEQFVSE